MRDEVLRLLLRTLSKIEVQSPFLVKETELATLTSVAPMSK